MATSKQYAYYLEGNKIAIVEKDVSFDNDVDSKDYGPGASRQRWESPQSSISQGLEIRYTYSPIWWLSSNRHIGWNLTASEDERNTSIYTPAYGEISGYLTFFFPGISANSGVLSISTTLNDNKIVCHNHPQWNGIHTVKSASTQGYIQTTTKWSSGLNKFEEDDDGETPIITTDGLFSNSTAGSWAEGWSIGDYFFNVTDMTNADNEGLFRINDINTGKTIITVDNHYHSDRTTSGELASATQSCSAESYTAGDLFMPQALLSEGAYVDVQTVNVMEDESFELDLPNYLQKALVYYLKAKLAEDAGELKLRESRTSQSLG